MFSTCIILHPYTSGEDVVGWGMGRPSTFTPEIAGRICDRLPFESLASICRDDDFPDQRTVYRWRREHDAFRRDYAHAREDRAHVRAERLDEINAMVARGELEPQAARVISDNEKWAMARMSPRDYGDRQVLAGDPEAPLHKPVSPDELVASIVRAMEEAERG